MKMIKYLIPFIFSLLVFAIIGFSPTDCIPETGQNACAVTSVSSEKKINFENCTFNGFPLYGKIKFVESFPDIKVKVVESFPDIKIKLVQNFPNDCGQWKIVENFPDVKVQLVESFPDVKVKFVENFPGKP